jgi:hypothetical protein
MRHDSAPSRQMIWVGHCRSRGFTVVPYGISAIPFRLKGQLAVLRPGTMGSHLFPAIPADTSTRPSGSARGAVRNYTPGEAIVAGRDQADLVTARPATM